MPPIRLPRAITKGSAAVHALLALSVLTVAGLGGTVLAAPPAAAATVCTLVASPTGSDSASGAVGAPFRTAQHLIDVVGPGQTGCLRAGTYSESLRFNRGGASGAPVTLTSYPGERATVVGRMYVPLGSNFVTVAQLSLDGRNASNLPSPTIYSSDVTFTGNDVTNKHTAICFDLGNTSYGRAIRVLIEKSRIHGCGRLPATNHDHGIYNEDSSYVTIAWNLIYDNADRGINFYPNAQNSSIVHNVIDGNGEGILFSGDFGMAASNNTVSYNVISNATIRHGVESWYPTGNPLGQGNSVQYNCLWGGVASGIDTSGGGFTPQNNTTANPQFANPTAGDYRMASASPCAGLAGDVQAAVDAAASPVVAPAPALVHITAAPSAASVTTGSLVSGSAADLAGADLQKYSVLAAGALTRTTAFTATFPAVPRTLSVLRLTYRGGATAPCTQTVSLYRFSTGVWADLDSRAATVADQTIADLAAPGAASDYVSGIGDVRARVRCASTPSGHTLNANQLQLTYDRP
ncbi:MAG: hypothetical protein QOG43_2252 [Actinomycetota bacterium]|jgi:hypothetical protein|nr:hypothetical protein [Actinomycetota bacterium]